MVLMTSSSTLIYITSSGKYGVCDRGEWIMGKGKIWQPLISE